MNLNEAFNEITNYSHFPNWAPDWEVVREVYQTFPNSYSVLTPFAYSYLEELIRSTTSEYGRVAVNKKDMSVIKYRKVGIKLIKLAIKENKDNNPEYVKILSEINPYFSESKITDAGDNRNSVLHGYIHPRFWDKKSFERLIFDIAKLSKYSKF
jgi:hypothetical protein